MKHYPGAVACLDRFGEPAMPVVIVEATDDDSLHELAVAKATADGYVHPMVSFSPDEQRHSRAAISPLNRSL